MHFSALGYSRPDGQTCDHWQAGRVEKLEWEPEFYRYVRDAFAPVGLMVDFWDDRSIRESKGQVPVILINDLDEAWQRAVTLRLRQDATAAPASELKQNARLEPLGQATVNFDLTWPDAAGHYILEAELNGAGGEPVRSVREVEVVEPHSLGLAYRKPVSASSSYPAQYAAANATDGDLKSYWASTFTGQAWLAVDLGEVHKIEAVRIYWDRAYSKVFRIQVSNDATAWTDVFVEEKGKGGVSDIKFAPVEARHVRLLSTKPATDQGHAVREYYFE